MENTSFQEWIKTRVSAVEERMSTYEILVTNGYELVDEDTAFQIPCFMHGPDAHPSARYYPGRPGHFYCFKCQVRMGPIDLYAKFANIKFMEALADLEKRFGIKIQQGSFKSEYDQYVTRDSNYESPAWGDVKRQLESLEQKLMRVKQKCIMHEFIGICRLLDSVYWDRERSDNDNVDMIIALAKAREKMNEISAREDGLL